MSHFSFENLTSRELESEITIRTRIVLKVLESESELAFRQNLKITSPK